MLKLYCQNHVFDDSINIGNSLGLDNENFQREILQLKNLQYRSRAAGGKQNIASLFVAKVVEENNPRAHGENFKFGIKEEIDGIKARKFWKRTLTI